jgi:cystathionine beta-lyase/cystathionine gamma-synthase
VTKFLAGHSDVVAGAVSTNDLSLHEEIQRRIILDDLRRALTTTG